MGNRSYPYLAGTKAFPKHQTHHVCCICGRHAVKNLEVQWSWMRGDDEFYPTCSYHLELAKEDLRKFMRLIPTKEEATNVRG